MTKSQIKKILYRYLHNQFMCTDVIGLVGHDIIENEERPMNEKDRRNAKKAYESVLLEIERKK